METIYTGNETTLHLDLANNVIKKYDLRERDIAYIRFCNILSPSDNFPVWTLKVIITCVINRRLEEYSDIFFLKNCCHHNFYTTYPQLKEVGGRYE